MVSCSNTRSVVIVQSLEELKRRVQDEIRTYGKYVDLNHLDVSQLESFDEVFEQTDFQGDISNWNVSNALSMYAMFKYSTFAGDISKWDVRKLKNAQAMFYKSNIYDCFSQWKLESIENTDSMFLGARIVPNFEYINSHSWKTAKYMFEDTKAPNGHIELWAIQDHTEIDEMLRRATMLFPRFDIAREEHYKKKIQNLYISKIKKYPSRDTTLLRILSMSYEKRERCATHYHNAVLNMLYPEGDGNPWLNALSEEDRSTLEALHQVSGSVHDAAIMFEQMKNDPTLSLATYPSIP